MNDVAFAHLASLLGLALAVAVVYSINMQGWRAVEAPVAGIVRRFIKIAGLLLYLAVIVQALTYAADAEGAAHYIATGIAGLLGALLFLALFFPYWIFPGMRQESADGAAAKESA